MPIYVDKRVRYQRQKLCCCYTCPHVIDEDNMFKCELAFDEFKGERIYRAVEPTSVCELYPGCNLKEEE